MVKVYGRRKEVEGQCLRCLHGGSMGECRRLFVVSFLVVRI